MMAYEVLLEEKLERVSGTLSNVLNPISPELFFQEHWNRKALHISGQADKFAGLFDQAAFHRAAHNCGDLKVGYTDDKGWPAHFQIRPDQIDEMLAAKKTVCASVIQNAEPALISFLDEFRKSFRVAGAFTFNSYLSPDGSGFGLHLDHHPVFILQLDGAKRWRYSPEPGLKQVITNVSFPAGRDVLKLPWVTVSRPPEESLCEAVLRPGDVLYLPKGCWHCAQAIGHSLALTLAMESVSLLDLVQAAMGPKLNTVRFRNALDAYSVIESPVSTPDQLKNVMHEGLLELSELVQNITVDDLAAVWERLEQHSANAQVQVARGSAAERSRVNQPAQF